MPSILPAYAPAVPLPGFPLAIEPHPNATIPNVRTLMRVFRNACEQGNLPLANDTFVTLRAAINEYALHHFEAVSDHMSSVIIALDSTPPFPTGADDATPTP